jgi:hypothetical protein
MLPAGVRTPAQRLDAHRLHRRGYVPTADPKAFQAEQVAQHPGTRNWMVEVQFVNPPHQRQTALRDRLRCVVGRKAGKTL